MRRITLALVIDPAPITAALAASVPFVGPETLARRSGIASADLLRLGANESSFGPAPTVQLAIAEAFSLLGYYGDPEAYELRAVLAEHCGVDPSEIIVGAGIDELLGLFVRAYVAPGETAAAVRGSYPTFTYHVAGHGAKLAMTDYEDDRINLDALATTAQQAAARLVYVANPDNPSGSYCDAAAIERFLDRASLHSMVLVDEAYADFAHVATPLVRDNVIRLRTFSKVHGLAGLRIGYAVGPAALLAPLEKIRNHFSVSRIAQVAAVAALKAEKYRASVVQHIARGRDDYAALGARLGLPTLPSKTNFVLFDCGTDARATALVTALFERNVFIRKPGLGSIARCVRITVGTPSERAALAPRLTEALAACDAKA